MTAALEPKRGSARRRTAGVVLAGLALVALAVSAPSPVAADPSPWNLVTPAQADPQADPGVGRFVTGWMGMSDMTGADRPVGYRKADDGSVRMRGVAVTFGVPATESAVPGLPAARVFRLPCQYRPRVATTTSSAAVTLDPQVGATGVESALISIGTDGWVEATSTALTYDDGGSPALRGGIVLDVVLDADQLLIGSDCDTAEPRTLYVAPDGDDGGEATIEDPLLTLAQAVEYVRAGDEIVLRGGTYPMESLFIGKSGTEGAPIGISSYPGELATLDGSQMLPRQPDNDYRTVLRLDGVSWINVTNIAVTGAPYLGIQCQSCNHTSWTGLRVHGNAGAGMQIIDQEPGDSSGDNVITDSDFFNNRDQLHTGESADGLELWDLRGEGNRLVRNRYWHNSDDGLDLFDTETAVVVEENWAWGNGVWIDDLDDFPLEDFEGDGFGFKLGGDGVGSPTNNPPDVAHLVVRSLAWDNGIVGFDSNGNGRLTALHNTSFRNQWRGFNVYKEVAASEPPSSAEDTTFDLRNNISLGNLSVHWYGPQWNGLPTEYVGGPLVVPDTNSWDDPDLTATVGDIDTSAAAEAEAEAEVRPASGGLPITTWLQVVSGSDLLDAGAVITGVDGFTQGTPLGAGPDLGAAEVG